MLRLPEPRTLRLMICAAVAAGVAGLGAASMVHAGSSGTVKSGGSAGQSRAGGGVTITSYGHSAVLVQGGGKRVLLNPFKAVGCAAGLLLDGERLSASGEAAWGAGPEAQPARPTATIAAASQAVREANRGFMIHG